MRDTRYDSVILMADTVDGIQAVEVEDCPDAEILFINEFIEELSTLEDNKRIFTIILPEGTNGDWERLDEEYGIHS